MRAIFFGLLGAAFAVAGSAQPLPYPAPAFDEGTQKLAAVAYSQAVDISLLQEQIYRAASAALISARDTPGEALAFAEKRAGDGSGLPAAVILDVDETVLDNSAVRAFLSRSGSGYSDAVWDDWVRSNIAPAIPGAVAFTQAAAAANIRVIYITNRACPADGQPAAPSRPHQNCPQKAETLALMEKLGFANAKDSTALLFAGENAQWAGDKKSRRAFVAQSYRIIMMIGDQLTDFVAGDVDTALRAALPQRPSSVALADTGAGGGLDVFRAQLGARWFLLPNAQYGKFDRLAESTDAKLKAVEAMGFEPALRLATWNAEWFMTPATFDQLASKPCATGSNPVSRTLPCDVIDPKSPNYMKRDQADIDAMARYAQALRADVVALEEVDGPDAAALLFPPEDWSFCFTGRGQTDTAGIYQRPVRDVGFVVRKGIGFQCEPPWREIGLSNNHVSWGARITLYPHASDAIDLVAVHLKSGCPAKKLTDSSDDCVELNAQTQLLKTWLTKWSASPRRLVLLGDFNRLLEFGRPANSAEQMWPNLDSADNTERDLAAVTQNLVYGKCAASDRYTAYVDQILLSRSLGSRADSASHVAFEPVDATKRRKLSDHCALVVRLRPMPERPVVAPFLPAAAH